MLFVLHTIILTILITKKRNDKEGRRQLLKVIIMSITSAVVMVSQMYIYLQTPHVVYVKYTQFFVCQLYINKVVKNIFS